MPDLETNSRRLIARLQRDGFELTGVRGSHHKFRKGTIVLVVPHPKKDLPVGTVRAIYRQAGWIKD